MPAKKKSKSVAPSSTVSRPATNPEARENQLIALAENLAEQQLRDGTASSQVIVHYLKLGSMKEKKEMKIMDNQAKLLEVKADSYTSAKEAKASYEKAIAALGEYRGLSEDGDYI